MATNATTGSNVDASTNKAEKAVSYAALILADAEIIITPAKLQALLKAANIEDVEPIWTTLFTKALEGKEVKDILTTVSASSPVVVTNKPPAQDDAEKDGENDGEIIIDDDNGDDGSDMEGMFDLFG